MTKDINLVVRTLTPKDQGRRNWQGVGGQQFQKQSNQNVFMSFSFSFFFLFKKPSFCYFHLPSYMPYMFHWARVAMCYGLFGGAPVLTGQLAANSQDDFPK